MTPGRNDPCPCGSGKKYKKCHELKLFNPYDPEIHQLKRQIVKSNLYERNLLLIQAIDEVFGFSRGTTINDVKSKISGEQIKELYTIIANIWPFTTDIYELLPKPSTELRALYLGDVFPEMILENVIRFSLYTDKIYVVNPFLSPWNLKKEFNPIHKPNPFKNDTLKLINFVAILEPWLKSGIIELIPYPGDFNYQLNMETYKLAEKRLENWSPSQKDIEEYEPYARKEFDRFFNNLPKEIIEQQLRNVNPDINEQEIQDFLNNIEKERKEDPLSLDQPFDGTESEGQFNLLRSGANLEMGLYISQITGAFPYTNISKRWEELLTARENLDETAQVWTPLTNAFQRLNFQFLNKVDSDFANRMREEGRLESFRNFIRKIWNGLEGEPDLNKMDSLARDFSDELKDEYHKAEADWQEINTDLIKWAGTTVSGGIITGGLSLEIPALGFGLATVSKLIHTYYKKSTFRKKVPMSVFIDLSKNRSIG